MMMGAVIRPPARAAITIAALAASSHGSFFSQAFFLSQQLNSRSGGHRNVVSISDAFGGNIQHVDTKQDREETTVLLEIKPDPYTLLEQVSHLQHFFFRSTICDAPQTVKYVIQNAKDTSYATAWQDYTTCYSRTPSDPNSRGRILDTTYQHGHLSWTVAHKHQESVYFSYFAPYSYERHLQLIAKCIPMKSAKVTSLGQSLDGRELDCITIGTGSKTCWMIHRQHPGESMAEYYAEGLLERLLGLTTNGSVDGTTCKALDMYTFYIVPNVNPDGAVRGHLRTNACGANLNREWASTSVKGEEDYYEAPTMERSPEVYYILQAMDKTGVDVFVDVHGDEELPFNFCAGAEGCPNWSPRLEALQGAFLAAYCRANSDMQQTFGYEPEAPGQGRLNTCSNQIATRFDCLGVTLEQPFKDCLSNPDPARGWNPARAKMLGASVLDALAYVHPFLRDDSDFWTKLPKQDAYVVPTSKYKSHS